MELQPLKMALEMGDWGYNPISGGYNSMYVYAVGGPPVDFYIFEVSKETGSGSFFGVVLNVLNSWCCSELCDTAFQTE